MPKPVKTKPAIVDWNLRAQQATRLRARGYTLEVCATMTGYASAGAVRNAILGVLQKANYEAAEELRKLDGECLDAMRVGLWPAATTGDPEAVRALLGVLARRARLFGLDLANEAQKLPQAAVQVLIQVNGSEGRPIPELTEAELVTFVRTAEKEIEGNGRK